VPHQESEDQVMLDMPYHTSMLSLLAKTSPHQKIVGWYSSGKELDYISSLLHQVYSQQVNAEGVIPVHLTVDVGLTDNKLATSAYTAKLVKGASGKDVLVRFARVPLSISATEAERIGVDALINSHPDEQKLDAPATILSDFENVELSLGKLLDQFEAASAYVNDVLTGKIVGDAHLGRALLEALAAVPKLDPAAHERVFNSQLQDLLLSTYLAGVTRSQVALADRLSTVLQ